MRYNHTKIRYSDFLELPLVKHLIRLTGSNTVKYTLQYVLLFVSFSSSSGPRLTLQTPARSLPHIIHNHWISLGSIHLHPKCRLLQEPSAPPSGDIPSQSPPEPPQLPQYGLRRARGEGAVGGPAPSGQLEDPVEGPTVQLPLLSTQLRLSQLPLHLLFSWPFSQPPSQEPLPSQELLSRPTLPAQRGRSDRGRGDGCGHRQQSKSRQQCGPYSRVCVHKIQPATNISAIIGAARRHRTLPLSWYPRERLQGSHTGPDAQQLHHQHSL